METLMNDKNDWDRNVEGDVVEDTVVCVCSEEVHQTLNGNRKSPWTI